jgi:acyl carrier protein
MGSVREEIRQYILSEFLPGETASNVQDDTPLRSSGILDSMATLRLVSFIEQRYGIEVEAHEASVENFETVGAIASFVASKSGSAS